MSKHLPFICLAALALLAPAARADETVQIQFDERAWKVVSQGTRGSNVITERVPDHEAADNWTELLTTQFNIGLQKRVTAENFVKAMESKLRNISTGKITWNVIISSPAEALYEWTLVKDHLRPDEQQIVRVIRGGEGLHIIHYASRKVPLPEATRQKWIQLLKAAQIVKQTPP